MSVNPLLPPLSAPCADDPIRQQESKKLKLTEVFDKRTLAFKKNEPDDTKGKVGAINPITGSSSEFSAVDTFENSSSQSSTATSLSTPPSAALNEKKTARPATKGVNSVPDLAKGLGLAAAGGAIGAGVAGATVVATQAPVDRSYFDHLNIRDQPINETPVLLSHNAGTEQGSLPILLTNQTMTIGDTLEKTPVRGFAIDLHYRDGVPVLNHGGVFDPRVESPPLSSALEPIAEFLDKPGNQSELVYIMLETYLGSEGSADALLEIKETFGERLFDPQQEHDFWQANYRLPTADELTANGPRVMVISNNTGWSGRNVAFEQGWANYFFGHTWEDRSLLGSMGTALHPDLVGEFDTDEMDRLINKGGFITIDQLSPNDPRFFKPEDRDLLAARPDISVAGFLHISDETATALTFGAGITTAVGASTFGLATGLYQGITHEKLIRNLDETLCQKLRQVGLTEIAETKRSRRVGTPSQITAGDLELHCSSSLKNSITWNTFKTGALSTSSIAAGFLGLAMLLPPVFPILTGVGIGVLALGLSATTVASVVNRRRLDKAIARALNTQKVQHQSAAREKSLQAELDEVMEDQQLLKEKLDGQRSNNILSRISSVFLASTVLLRVSSMAKYATSLLGTISWVALGLVTTVSTVINSTLNYRKRQKRRKKPGDTTLECVMPQVERKRFWFFGSTALERFVRKNRDTVGAALHQEPGVGLKELLRSLNHPDNEQARQRITLQCSMGIIQKDVIKFAKKKKVVFHEAQKCPRVMKKLVEEFLQKRVAQAAHRDTMIAGATNTARITAVFGGLSFIFPPVTGILLGVAALVPVIGLVVTKIAAVNERKRFHKAMRACQDLPDKSPQGDVRAKLAQHQSQKLRTFTRLVSEAACRSCET